MAGLKSRARATEPEAGNDQQKKPSVSVAFVFVLESKDHDFLPRLRFHRPYSIAPNESILLQLFESFQ
jgi:hypothetical protein